ncbi:hypothetical protein BH23BAC1_BH23BAC1_38710 [soil metagenome]
MKSILFIFVLFLPFLSFGQYTFNVIVRDAQTKEALVGVNAVLENSDLGSSSDVTGLITITNIPAGRKTIIFSSIGYKTLRKNYTFPVSGTEPLPVFMVPEEEELEDVIIRATRGSRTIQDIPTRIEVITSEELDEKAVMNSANIAMLLRESTGILVQQTSANSANASIRIQGLDGRYTQILKDGFPLYGGFASGLSIMQIPPLDLNQVEVIKGSTSTLYGGGAIAGLINLVSKLPEEEPELSLMVNQTTALGTTVNGFYAQKFNKTGYTLYTSANRQEPYDPNKDGFSNIPWIRSISLNPRFFYYPDQNTNLNLGVNTSFENRIGGDIQAIEGNGDSFHSFMEKNVSDRISSQLAFERNFGNLKQFSLKNSLNYFNRQIILPDFKFEGSQLASFTEITYSLGNEIAEWILGANLYTDNFDEKPLSDQPLRNYQHTTWGAFAQNNWRLNRQFFLETGLRIDYNNDYGLFVLPRISGLYKIFPNLSLRAGGGLGYKIPTIFTEEAERLTYQNLLPISPEATEAEKSTGGNVDINYRVSLGKFFLTINQLFFYTRLQNSLVMSETGGNFRLMNADGPINSRGAETNIKLSYADFNLFFNYTFINAQLNYDNINRQKPLTPRHNAGLTLMYENEDWRIGYELYYIGEQFRSDYSRTQDFWMMGLMGMHTFRNFSIFINFENFTDTRQSRFQAMVFPPHNDPTFTEIWAPTDGFVANAGIKVDILGRR